MRGNSESINKPLYLMVWVREGADTWRPDTIHRRRRRLAFGLCRAKHEVRSALLLRTYLGSYVPSYVGSEAYERTCKPSRRRTYVRRAYSCLRLENLVVYRT